MRVVVNERPNESNERLLCSMNVVVGNKDSDGEVRERREGKDQEKEIHILPTVHSTHLVL